MLALADALVPFVAAALVFHDQAGGRSAGAGTRSAAAVSRGSVSLAGNGAYTAAVDALIVALDAAYEPKSQQ
jgi:microcompartment protein CcmK/EutM